MTKKDYYLQLLNDRGYDNPKLSELSESALKAILKRPNCHY